MMCSCRARFPELLSAGAGRGVVVVYLSGGQLRPTDRAMAAPLGPATSFEMPAAPAAREEREDRKRFIGIARPWEKNTFELKKKTSKVTHFCIAVTR